jgi:hypothetical protein
MADLIVMITIGETPDGWWSAVATRARGGHWQAVVRSAEPELVPLISRLARGRQLPPRGVTHDVMARLGRFLLPEPGIWAGTPAGPRSLVIVPDPRLWHLPHAALIRDGVHLADVAEVTFAPSLRTLELLLRRPEAAPAPLDRPVLSDLDRTLPGFAVESAALDGWPAGHDRLPGLAVSHPDAAMLYVSGHGAAAGPAPRFGANAISLDTLASAGRPRLVILNGCWSGTAASRYGQDPLSLAVGALLGGATTVIAGVGRVGSVSSAHVGAALAGRLREGRSPAAALRLAQCELRDRHPDLGPFDWAGLCAIGLGH